ncbi:MAG: hypothetical protein QOJ02_1237 [Acidobacteriota bacterium]|jgi:hypothetical protein|nr:hypothetical protein [Acidobacteriota bacterium]
MRSLQQFCAALALTLALAMSAFAGDISCPGATATPPPPPPQQLSVTGHISFPDISTTRGISTLDVAALDPLTEATFSLLQSILSIF